jgi:hypothetical protein
VARFAYDLISKNDRHLFFRRRSLDRLEAGLFRRLRVDFFEVTLEPAH